MPEQFNGMLGFEFFRFCVIFFYSENKTKMLVAAKEKRTDVLSFVVEVNVNFSYRNIRH